MFGSGAGNGGSLNVLYFTDGLNGETAGLFGAISAVPEPSGLLVLGTGLALVGLCRALGAFGVGWNRRRRSLLIEPVA
jgi:hypothetical protein